MNEIHRVISITCEFHTVNKRNTALYQNYFKIQLVLNLKPETLECIQQRVRNYNTKINQQYTRTM